MRKEQKRTKKRIYIFLFYSKMFSPVPTLVSKNGPDKYIAPKQNAMDKKYKCCCNGGIRADQLMTVLAALAIVATIVAVIFAIVFASNADSLQRYSITATPENVALAGGVGETGGLAIGHFELKWVERQMSYYLQYYDVSTITAIHIRGPIPPNSRVGPFKFSLCGSPSTQVCDVTTNPGVVQLVLDQISPSGTGVRPEITAIRKEPRLYYLEILTTNFPTTPGALRAELGFLAGTP